MDFSKTKSVGFGVALGVTVVAWAFVPNPISWVCTFHGWIAVALTCCALIVAAFFQRGAGIASPILAGLAALAAISPYAVSGGGGGLILPGAILLAMAAAPFTRAALWRTVGAGLWVWAAFALYGWYAGPLSAAQEKAGRLDYLCNNLWPSGGGWWVGNTFPLGHANYTAGMGVLLLPLFWGLAAQDRKRKLLRMPWVVGVLLSGGLIYSGGSRVSIPALALAVMAWLAVTRRPEPIARHRVKILAGVALVGPALAMLIPGMRAWVFNPVTKTYSDRIRRDYVEGVWRLVQENPFTGVGSGGVPMHYGAHQGPTGDQPSCYQVHSTPVQWVAEYGLPGALLYPALLVALLWALRRVCAAEESREAPLAAGVSVAALAYALFCLFDYQLNLPVFALLFGVMAGATLGTLRDPAAAPGPVSGRGRFAWVVPLALLAFAAVREIPARAHAVSALRAIESGRTEDGVRALQAAESADPGNPAYPVLLAAYMSSSEAMQAKSAPPELVAMTAQAWQRGLAKAPDAPFLDAQFAAFLLNHDTSAAKAIAARSLLKFPKMDVAWLVLAHAYAKENNPAAAAEMLAIRSLLLPETLYTPSLRKGVFRTDESSVAESFRRLSASYMQSEPDDRYGAARLNDVRQKLDAWEAAGRNGLSFVQKNADWAPHRQWKDFRRRILQAEAEAQKESRDSQYRLVLGASMYELYDADIKLIGGIRITKAFRGEPVQEGEGFTLSTTTMIPVFGTYSGCGTFPTLPSPLKWEADPIAGILRLHTVEDSPHLRSRFFEKRVQEIIQRESRGS